ncbi:MAG: hypothetical protein ACI4GO_03020 [Hominenteromicrobium sp.]
MTQTEMRLKLLERSKSLESRFELQFENRVINERVCFLHPAGVIFSIGSLLSFGALVVEYADNEKEAELSRFEDGELFYLEDMDEDAMYQGMIQEIEQ